MSDDDKALAIRQAIGVERLGEIMWKSGYWQDTRSQAQAIVKILAGAELNIGPISSMNGVYIIEGRTSLAAQLIASRIQASGRYRYRVAEHDDSHCVIEFFELVGGGKRERIGTSSFSLEDAKKAQLLGKRSQMWEKFPRNMVFSRALSNGAKWYTPDVFNGPVYTPDELGAEVDVEGNVVEVQPYVPTDVREVDDAARHERMVTSADDRVWKRWEFIRDEGLKYIGAEVPSISLPMGYEQLVNIGLQVKAKTDLKKQQLAREDAERAAAAAEHQGPSNGADTEPGATQDPLEAVSPPADPWERNRQLMLAAFEAGYKLRELPVATPRDEVEIRNGEIEQLLESGARQRSQ